MQAFIDHSRRRSLLYQNTGKWIWLVPELEYASPLHARGTSLLVRNACQRAARLHTLTATALLQTAPTLLRRRSFSRTFRQMPSAEVEQTRSTVQITVKNCESGCEESDLAVRLLQTEKFKPRENDGPRDSLEAGTLESATRDVKRLDSAEVKRLDSATATGWGDDNREESALGAAEVTNPPDAEIFGRVARTQEEVHTPLVVDGSDATSQRLAEELLQKLMEENNRRRKSGQEIGGRVRVFDRRIAIIKRRARESTYSSDTSSFLEATLRSWIHCLKP